MKQVYLTPSRYSTQPRGAYMSFDNAAAACVAFGFDVGEIEAVPVLDSEHPSALDAYPFDAMAHWLKQQGGEQNGV